MLLSRSATRKSFFVSLIISIFFTFGVAACASSSQNPSSRATSPTSPLASRIDAYLTSEVKAEEFSGTVLIAKDGKVVLSKGYSMASWKQNIPNTVQTKFAIGSITKSFTAIALLLLQEKGKVHIQDRVCLYLPSCAASWRLITLHQLLDHTAGIPRDVPGLSQVSQILVQLEKEPLVSPLGSHFNYSNAGYFLLGLVIEKASGISYADFLQQQIFTPLKMTNTGYDYTNPNVPNLAIGYSGWREPASVPNIVHEFSAYGLYSTVGDLYRLDQALATGTPALLSQKSLQAMFTPYVLPCSQSDCAALSIHGYGYGWYVGERYQSRYLFHPGDTLGTTAYNAFYPDANVSIIVLGNIQSQAAETVRASLDPIVFEKNS